MMWVIIILAFLAVYIITAKKFMQVVVRPQKRDYETVLEIELKRNHIQQKRDLQFISIEYGITSTHGYEIYAHYYQAKEFTGQYVLFNHGYNFPYASAFKYLSLFLDRGINVLVPDHRYCGKSGGNAITFGYYEHQDSILWIDKLEVIAKDEGILSPIIGVMGESMGAATAILIAKNDKRIKFCIADCSFSSWDAILKYQCRQKYGKWMLTVVPLVEWMIERELKLEMKEVDIEKAIKEVNVPTLLIHGKDDLYVPLEMARKLHQANPYTKLFIQAGAKHAESVAVDYATYKQQINTFLDEIID